MKRPLTPPVLRGVSLGGCLRRRPPGLVLATLLVTFILAWLLIVSRLFHAGEPSRPTRVDRRIQLDTGKSPFAFSSSLSAKSQPVLPDTSALHAQPESSPKDGVLERVRQLFLNAIGVADTPPSSQGFVLDALARDQEERSKDSEGGVIPFVEEPLGEILVLKRMRKQRLKPWTDILILGGEVCPGPGVSHSQETILDKESDTEKDVSTTTTTVWNNLQDRSRPDTLPRIPQCPRFVPCQGALPDVHFCKIRGMSELRIEPFDPPKDLHGRSWSELMYSASSLPWEGALVAVTGGAYTNQIGQVFTNRSVQYLHGGCQDLVDRDHGGERRYSPTSSDIRVRRFRNVLNLVHLYGDNYYHFLVEVLPRFFLASSLLQQFPAIPILVRKNSPVHLLRLLGYVHPSSSLNLHFIHGEKQLVYAEENMLFPLAPRCLHAPKTLWRRIRGDFSRKLASRVDGLPSDFSMPLSFAHYVRQAVSWVEEAPLGGGSGGAERKEHENDEPASPFLEWKPPTRMRDQPVVKIVYMSRLNMAPRRHLQDEQELVKGIRELFRLNAQTKRIPRNTLVRTLDDGEMEGISKEEVTTYYAQRMVDATVDNSLVQPSTPTATTTTTSDANHADTETEMEPQRLPVVTLTLLYGNESLATVIETLAGAAVVISPHGAAMANLIFAPSHTHVWEIAPEGYWNPCYLYLSNALHLRHGLIRAEGMQATELTLGERNREDLLAMVESDVRVRQVHFQATLAALRRAKRESLKNET